MKAHSGAKAPLHNQGATGKLAANVNRPWLLTGDKYSPNLKRWMVKNGGSRNEVFRDADGALQIGWIDDTRFFIGSRLARVLTSGGRAEVGCWMTPVAELTPVDGFWDDYARIGRCAIDTRHALYFIGGDTRWAEDGDTRSCLWCGQHTQTRRRWTETVERECWEATPASAVGTKPAPCGRSAPNPAPNLNEGGER